MKRTYHIPLTNECSDLRTHGGACDTIERLVLQVTADDGRHAKLAFEWIWLLDSSAFKVEMFGDALWAVSEFADVFTHLAAWSDARRESTLKDVEMLLIGLGCTFNEPGPPSRYVGRITPKIDGSREIIQ